VHTCVCVCAHVCALWGGGQPAVPVLELVPTQGLPTATGSRAVPVSGRGPARGCVFGGPPAPPPCCPPPQAPRQGLPGSDSTGLPLVTSIPKLSTLLDLGFCYWGFLFALTIPPTESLDVTGKKCHTPTTPPQKINKRKKASWNKG